MAKLKSSDATGGNADTAAAKAIQPDIDKTYAGDGVTEKRSPMSVPGTSRHFAAALKFGRF